MPEEMPIPWAEGIFASCSILVPSPWPRHHIPQELSLQGLSTPLATGAIASTAGLATVRCLAFVQRAALVNIKGPLHYSGSPSNYAPAIISCGSLQAIQAALGWADITL